MQGLILDLTRIPESGEVVFDDLIVEPERDQREREQAAPYTPCGVCGVIYRCWRQVGDVSACYMCFTLSHASSEMVELIRTAYSGPCTACGKKDGVKHFDHKNMFDKTGVVMGMTHMSVDNVQAEIAKCQLLCIDCHKKITGAECRLGFTAKKVDLNRMQRIGVDISELRRKYMEEYEVVMRDVYVQLRGGVNSR